LKVLSLPLLPPLKASAIFLALLFFSVTISRMGRQR